MNSLMLSYIREEVKLMDSYYYLKTKVNKDRGSYTVDSSGSDCRSDVERLAWCNSKTTH